MLHETRTEADKAEFDSGPETLAVGSGIPQTALLGLDLPNPFIPLDKQDTGAITIPDAHLLFSGQFKRLGESLKLVGDDGKSFLIAGYFKTEHRAALVSPDGARLSGSIVEALAGPANPGQYAQTTVPQSDAQNIGRVATVSGNATVVRNGVTVALNVGDAVLKGDVVQTGTGSALGITFLDGSTFNLTAAARIVLSEFIFDPSGPGNSQLVNLIQGGLTFVSGQVAKSGNMKIGTPVATMGIRGTVGQSTINANDGTVTFTVVNSGDGLHSADILDSSGNVIARATSEGGMIVVRPAGPLQVVAQEISKEPAQLAVELAALNQVLNTQGIGQQMIQQIIQQPPDQKQPDPNTKGTNGQGTQVIPSDGTKLTIELPSSDKLAAPDNAVAVVRVVTTDVANATIDKLDKVEHLELNETVPIPAFHTIVGTDAGETIVGTPIKDFIYAEGGDDVIDAGAGDDVVFAGSGNDVIIAGHGEGDDFYDGGDGNDTITFTSTTQGVAVNLADSEVQGVAAHSAKGTEIGTDTLVNIEKITGGSGADTLIGDDAANVIDGYGGADRVYMRGGDDVFLARDGARWFVDGGDGIDTIRFVGALQIGDSDSGPETPSSIEIVDLNTGFANSLSLGGGQGIRDANDQHAMRILGGTTDTLTLQPPFPNELQGKWTLIEQGVSYEGDDLTAGVLFNKYAYLSGDELLATAFVQDGISVRTPEIRQLIRVSTSSSGEQGNHYSGNAIISPDGAPPDQNQPSIHALFGLGWYAQTPIISGDGSNIRFQVNGQMLVYHLTDGTTANLPSSEYGFNAQRSADGRFIAYQHTIGPQWALSIYDNSTGITETLPINDSAYPSLSADGRYLAFESGSSSLVADDTNNLYDVFVYDRLTGLYERVSVNSNGGQALGGDSWDTWISPDGRYVGFESAASNLVPGDTNGTWDILIYDRVTHEMDRIPVEADVSLLEWGLNFALSNAISPDGRFVTFSSSRADLVPDDTNAAPDVFIYDRLLDTTERLSVDGSSQLITSGGWYSYYIQSVAPSISDDGRYVAFQGIRPTPFGNFFSDIFLVDRGPQAHWSITADNAVSAEDDGSITFTISRSEFHDAEIVYVSTTQDRGSANRSDYVGRLNTALTFEPGQASRQIQVSITNDSVHEDIESFGIIVQQSPDDPIATHLAASSFTIVDDDPQQIPGQVTLKPGAIGQDLWITSFYSYGDNFGVNGPDLRVGGWADSYYSLLKFDLENNALPAHVDHATLRLYNYQFSDYIPTGIYVDQIQTAWDESYGWYDYHLNYTTIGSLSAPTTGWVELDITAAVNAWLSDPSSNDGIQLRPFGTNHNMTAFVSSDATGDMARFRPELVLSFDPAPSHTAEEIFASESKLAFLAKLANAAYHLLPEPFETHQAGINNQASAGSEAAFAEVGSSLRLLTAADMPSLAPHVEAENLDFPLVGLKDGFYLNDNAAALIGRTDDSLFISFRGTNDLSGTSPSDMQLFLDWLYSPAYNFSPDVDDWNEMPRHFSLFSDLNYALTNSNHTGYLDTHEEITHVYVTGHSLGAAMGQAFMEQHFGSAYEAVLFANPGYDLSLTDDGFDARIENFFVDDDPILGAAAFTSTSGDENTFLHSSAISGVQLHAMSLYQAYAKFLGDAGVALSDIDGSGGFDFDSIVANAHLVIPTLDQYRVGDQDDILEGTVGRDLFVGGEGGDTFVFRPQSNADTIWDFSGHSAQGDKIELENCSFVDFSELQGGHLHDIGSGINAHDTLIDLGNGDSITLRNVELSTLVADDFVFRPHQPPGSMFEV